MSEEELSAMSAHDRRSLQKQYAHFWRKDSVYLRLLSNIGEGRIEYNRPNSQYYCGRHDFVYNFGTSDELAADHDCTACGYYQLTAWRWNARSWIPLRPVRRTLGPKTCRM